jgi:hypothetical protein
MPEVMAMVGAAPINMNCTSTIPDVSEPDENRLNLLNYVDALLSGAVELDETVLQTMLKLR